MISFLTPALSAEIQLPAVLGNHMVLQQKEAITLWGWAEPGENIFASLGDQKSEALVDGEGRWEIVLPAMEATSAPLQLSLTGTQSAPVVLSDILVGEVWVCSGQSNMEWEMRRTHSPSPEIRRADFPLIRLFHIPRKFSAYPLDNVDAEWEVCKPQTIRDFSAVAYYFGREIHQNMEIPVGLISTRWGGTRIEPWTPAAGFQSVPELEHILGDMKAPIRTKKMAA
jgi:sialate O-acetylesterase